MSAILGRLQLVNNRVNILTLDSSGMGVEHEIEI